MKNKIKNWVENHERICGVGLLCVSLCAIAFGGAYMGAQAGVANSKCVVNLYGPDGVVELVTE